MPGTRKQVRLVDVAREAGVSVGAASDALSGKNRLPESTRARVREAAERLGYRPDLLAKALRTGNAGLLGLLIGSIDRRAEFDLYRTFWAGLVASLSAAATQAGYTLCIIPGVDAVTSLRLPLSGLVAVDVEPATLEELFALGVPVGSTNAPGDGRLAVDIQLDVVQMVRIAGEHLSARGASRPGLLWPVGPGAGADLVAEAFAAWCAESSVDPVVEQFEVEQDALERAIHRLLDRGVDGVLTIAPGAESLLAECARRERPVLLVSRAVATDAVLEEMGVTSVGFSLEDSADEVVASLIDLAEGRRDAPVRVAVPFQLTERASTAR